MQIKVIKIITNLTTVKRHLVEMAVVYLLLVMVDSKPNNILVLEIIDILLFRVTFLGGVFLVVTIYIIRTVKNM